MCKDTHSHLFQIQINSTETLYMVFKRFIYYKHISVLPEFKYGYYLVYLSPSESMFPY